MPYYVCRKRGALGIATEVVEMASADELGRRKPDLEPLAVYETIQEVRKHLVDIQLDIMAGKKWTGR